MALACSRLEGEGTARYLLPTDVDAYGGCLAVTHVPEPQLCIETDVVIPGEPIDGVKLVIWQGHDLVEADRNPSDVVNHALRRYDVLCADDFYRSFIDSFKAHALTLTYTKGEGTTEYWCSPDRDCHVGG